MRARTVLFRGLLVLALLPVALLGILGWKEAEYLQASDHYYASAYDLIHMGMWEPTVEKLLGSPGRPIEVPTWPRTLGEIPGYENGYTIPCRSSNRLGRERHFVVPPSSSVWWRVWEVPGEYRWIAVGLHDDLSGGSLGTLKVIAKKSGLGTRGPHK